MIGYILVEFFGNPYSIRMDPIRGGNIWRGMSFKQSSKNPVIAVLFMYFLYLATTLRSRPVILERLQLFFRKARPMEI